MTEVVLIINEVDIHEADTSFYLTGHVVSLDTFADPHLAAVLLKKYLRDLPEPLFPEAMYSTIRRCPMPTTDPGDVSSIMYIRETLLPELPHCAYILLSHIFRTWKLSLTVRSLSLIFSSIDLLHEVSLRSASNRMDAHNLAVVICPNLVKSSNPVRDVMMCSVPGSPAMFSTQEQPPAPQTNSAALTEGKTTLGVVVKLCIQRYYEIFDELPDRTEALPQRRPVVDDGAPPPGVRNSVIDDDEDIDDAMLVMPLGPDRGRGDSTASPPTAWTGAHRPSSSRDWRSVAGTAGNGFQSQGKAKSMISIEKGKGEGTMRKGSIAIGRGTTRGKGSGSGVEAMGVTAAGFFAAPKNAPPVPPRPAK